MEVGRRLRQMRRVLRLDQREVAELLGIPLRTYQNYERGKTEPKAAVSQRLHEYGIDASWLLSGAGEMIRPRSDAAKRRDMVAGDGYRPMVQAEPASREGPPLAPDGFIMVPCYGLSAVDAAALADQANIVDRVALQRGVAWRLVGLDPKSLMFMVAVGDHMEPLIRAGDLLLVDRSVTRFVDPAIYAIEIAGGLELRRIQRLVSGGVVLKSENTNYDDETLTADQVERLKIAGRVRWIVRLI